MENTANKIINKKGKFNIVDVAVIVFIGLFIFILIRRPKDSIPVFTFITAVCLMALLFPRVATGRVVSIVMELCSGMILFGAVFFISSPFFAPKRTVAKFFWGFVSGIICMVIRYVCPFEEGACFGFLISCVSLNKESLSSLSLSILLTISCNPIILSESLNIYKQKKVIK